MMCYVCINLNVSYNVYVVFVAWSRLLMLSFQLLFYGPVWNHAPIGTSVVPWSSIVSCISWHLSCPMVLYCIMHQLAPQLSHGQVLYHAPVGTSVVPWSSIVSCTSWHLSCPMVLYCIMHQLAPQLLLSIKTHSSLAVEDALISSIL